MRASEKELTAKLADTDSLVTVSWKSKVLGQKLNFNLSVCLLCFHISMYYKH